MKQQVKLLNCLQKNTEQLKKEVSESLAQTQGAFLTKRYWNHFNLYLRCHQQLRIPANIGGMLMCCAGCGHEFHTDFKLGPIVLEGKDGKEPARKTPLKRPPSTLII